MVSSADILEVRDLKVWFPVKTGVFGRTVGHVKAVDGVSFAVRQGETLGIVGESGSGKSTLARTVAGLVRPTSGSFRLANGCNVGMVFQDPLGSLNPRQTVRAALREVIERSGNRLIETVGDPVEIVSKTSTRSQLIDHAVVKLLELVGLDADALDRYPHEFSGGQRQRVCIARAIAGGPKLLLCDEAVSALDLSVRAKVLDLLAALRDRLGLTLVFITHDLGVVRRIADRILVMHRGKVVETGSCAAVLADPQEVYTRCLLASVPRLPAVSL